MLIRTGLVTVGFVFAFTSAGCSKQKKAATVPAPAPATSHVQAKDHNGVALTGVRRDGTEINFAPIYFDYDTAELSEPSRDELASLARHLDDNPRMHLTIEGHTDERGTVEYNLALGDRRARAIKDYLVTLGVGDARLAIISYGKERPAVAGSGEGAWAKNRRGELIRH